MVNSILMGRIESEVKQNLGVRVLNKEWTQFMQNLSNNVDDSVYLFTQEILSNSYGDKKTKKGGYYFSPVQGFNMGANGFYDTHYSIDGFRGYCGYGKYLSENLTTQKVFKLLSSEKAVCKKILRVDMRTAVMSKGYPQAITDVLTMDSQYANNADTCNTIYYTKQTQYNWTTIPNAGDCIYKIYKDVIERFIAKVDKGNLSNIPFEKIGAIEMILPKIDFLKEEQARKNKKDILSNNNIEIILSIAKTFFSSF